MLVKVPVTMNHQFKSFCDKNSTSTLNRFIHKHNSGVFVRIEVPTCKIDLNFITNVNKTCKVETVSLEGFRNKTKTLNRLFIVWEYSQSNMNLVAYCNYCLIAVNRHTFQQAGYFGCVIQLVKRNM